MTGIENNQNSGEMKQRLPIPVAAEGLIGAEIKVWDSLRALRIVQKDGVEGQILEAVDGLVIAYDEAGRARRDLERSLRSRHLGELCLVYRRPKNPVRRILGALGVAKEFSAEESQRLSHEREEARKRRLESIQEHARKPNIPTTPTDNQSSRPLPRIIQKDWLGNHI